MKFVKMQGAGNDFVLLDGREGQAADWPELARRMCDRHFGAGADGLLLAGPAETADVAMRMWNPDGSQSEMCGNGIRCFARWLLDGPFRGRSELRVATGAGRLAARARADGWIEASMGRPVLNGRDIPVAVDAKPVLDLPLPDLGIAVTCVSMGNPHAVQFVPAVEEVDLASLGPRVEHHPLFPRRVNVHLCQVVSAEELVVRHWERGAGLTLACGTGVCAAAVAARLHGRAAEHVRVHVPGGELDVSWDGAGEVLLAGPAEYVYEGEWLGEVQPAR